MDQLQSLRHLAKEILGLAVLELFPSAQLIEGDVDDVSFFYDFYFPKNAVQVFSQREIEQIEDRMRLIVLEGRSVKKLEMMRENAVHYLAHLKQPLRAQAAEDAPENIVTLLEIGQFRDLCPAVNIDSTKSVKAFQLLEYEVFDDKSVRILGTAFFDGSELKKFAKKYRAAKKIDFRNSGPENGYLLFLGEKWILLPKGEEILKNFYDLWRAKHQELGYNLLFYQQVEEAEIFHEKILKEKRLKKIAVFSSDFGDLASFMATKEGELLDEVISSLHFIRKVFKIFGFETQVVCLQSKPSILAQALEKEGFDYEWIKSKEGPALEFWSPDCYGRKRILSFLRIEEEKKLLHRSLFWSIENWIALCIEKGVDRV